MEVVPTLREGGLKRVWLMGGGELAASFRTVGLITRCMIFVVPILLGGGVRLFADARERSPLSLVHAKHYSSGLVHLDYSVG